MLKRTFTGSLKLNDQLNISQANNYINNEASRKKTTSSVASMSEIQKNRFKISTITKYTVKILNENLSDDIDTTKLMKSDLQNSFLPKFLTNLKNYLLYSVPYDVVIMLENGKRLNAHRIMLETSSGFFKRKFEQSNNQKKNSVWIIKLNEINDFKMLKTCVDYIYSGGRDISFKSESIYNLQSIAEKLELNDLSNLCLELIRKNEEHIQSNQKDYLQNLPNDESFVHFTGLTEPNSVSFTKFIQNFHLAQMRFENKYFETIESNKKKQNTSKLLGIKTEENKKFTNTTNFFLPSTSNSLIKVFSTVSESCSPSSLSSSPILDDPTKTIIKPICLFEDSMASINIKDYLNEKIILSNSAFSPVNSLSFEVDTIGSQFSILNKYIYPSMINNDNDLIKNHVENFLFLYHSMTNLNENNSEFRRDSFVVFCLQINNQKLNNLLFRARLNFADFSDLKNDIKRNLESCLNKIFESKLTNDLKLNGTNIIINRLFYLKKPANCKTIRLDQIKSSTDCFRAIVEYSRFNELNEKPIVFMTLNASVSIKFK